MSGLHPRVLDGQRHLCPTHRDPDSRANLSIPLPDELSNQGSNRCPDNRPAESRADQCPDCAADLDTDHFIAHSVAYIVANDNSVGTSVGESDHESFCSTIYSQPHRLAKLCALCFTNIRTNGCADTGRPGCS